MLDHDPAPPPLRPAGAAALLMVLAAASIWWGRWGMRGAYLAVRRPFAAVRRAASGLPQDL